MPRVLLWLAFLLCFTLAQPQRYLDVREGEASCFRSRVLEAQTNRPVPLPPYVSEHLNCGNVSLSPNGRWLTFIKSDQLLWWDFETRRTLHLTDLPQLLDGLELSWTFDSTRLALLLIQQPSALEKHLEVRVFRTGPDGVVGEQRFYLPIAFVCGSSCSPRVFHWNTPLELVYQTSINYFSEPVSDPRLLSESRFFSNHHPRYSFLIDEALEAKLPLSVRAEISLKVQPSKQLEVRGPGLYQRFALNGSQTPSRFWVNVLLDDFNFDGWLDLAVPHRVDESVGKVTYILHTYSPARNRFVELTQAGKPLFLDNPALDSKQKLLMTLTPSGWNGSGRIYRFEQGRPWLYRTRTGHNIADFASDWDVVYQVSEFDPSGKPIRHELSEFPSAFKPVLRRARREMVLFPSPENPLEIGRLSIGTQVKVVGIQEIGQVRWLEVEAGNLKGWVKL